MRDIHKLIFDSLANIIKLKFIAKFIAFWKELDEMSQK